MRRRSATCSLRQPSSTSAFTSFERRGRAAGLICVDLEPNVAAARSCSGSFSTLTAECERSSPAYRRPYGRPVTALALRVAALTIDRLDGHVTLRFSFCAISESLRAARALVLDLVVARATARRARRSVASCLLDLGDDLFERLDVLGFDLALCGLASCPNVPFTGALTSPL